MTCSLPSLRPLRFVFPLWALGCASVPQSSTSLLKESPRLLVISETPGPLATEAPIPVLSPPQVFAVWVPSHVDRPRDILVGEHWLFFKLTESEWFTDRKLAEATPPAEEDASPQSLTPLRAVTGFEKAVVPYREAK
ncbi:MAG: hypothetical protein HYY16_01815 [Planctomycetes bacterium]|nr:hypothetical protein [Planctomycetota bacterium]